MAKNSHEEFMGTILFAQYKRDKEGYNIHGTLPA